MFSRKKDDGTKKSRRSDGGLAQFGLIDIPDFDNLGPMNGMEEGDDDDEDDEALEAELMALTSGAPITRKQKKAPVAVASDHLDRMVAESLRDIPSDESVSGEDDDPALLNELSGLVSDEEPDVSNAQFLQPQRVVQESLKRQQPSSPCGGLESLLNERLEMYKLAEANAKSAGEASRARRFNRGIKTLGDLLKQTKAGRTIDESEIPPPVAVQITKKTSAPAPVPTDQTESDSQPPPTLPIPPPVPPRSVVPPVPQRSAPPPPPPSPGAVPLPGLVQSVINSTSELVSHVENETVVNPSAPFESIPAQEDSDEKDKILALLTTRRDEYKVAAVKAKKEGNVKRALQFVKISKQFDVVISAVKEGKSVDLSAMPPPPPTDDLAPNIVDQHQTPVLPEKEEQEKQRSSEPAAPSEPKREEEEEAAGPVEEYQVTASSVLEALEQRLTVYQGQEEAARAAGNSSKERRMGRIVKQYRDAIKLHKAGKPIPVDDLPTPPGYAPIPVENKEPVTAPSSTAPATPASVSPAKPVPTPPSKPSPPTSPEQDKTAKPVNNTASEVTNDKATQKVNARRGAVERQMSFLTSRQKEFRLAALEAKKKGELNQAKEYLRLAKGFEPLLDAASSGLPIDMDSVPIPPSSKVVLESDFDVICANDCNPNSDSEVFDKLENDLTAQLKMCMQTRNHFKAIGDVASANRFEQLALHSKKDLDVLRLAHKRNEPVPRFHYETKSFSIVQCNTDLTDNDLELTIIQGVNYNVPNPKEVDTYIKFEFPYPSEDPPKNKTSVIYNTNNPEYNMTFPLTIKRTAKACQRVFKRHSIKCEVWAKGGFFKYDNLIGTAFVKLQPLETKCTLHDSFDLMVGRKAVGGKLEVKVRIRNPILTKQVEQVQEKWLVIDH